MKTGSVMVLVAGRAHIPHKTVFTPKACVMSGWLPSHDDDDDDVPEKSSTHQHSEFGFGL